MIWNWVLSYGWVNWLIDRESEIYFFAHFYAVIVVVLFVAILLDRVKRGGEKK